MGVSGMPVANTPTCLSQVDPHRVESDNSDFFRGRRPADRNPTAYNCYFSEGTHVHSVDLNVQRCRVAPNISQDRPPSKSWVAGRHRHGPVRPDPTERTPDRPPKFPGHKPCP